MVLLFQCIVYELEKKSARKAHRIKAFPPLSGWESGDYVLSQDQLELRCGPSNSVTDLRTYTHKDDHGRYIKYAVINSAKKTASSCVSLRLDSVLSQGEMKFGQITRNISACIQCTHLRNYSGFVMLN